MSLSCLASRRAQAVILLWPLFIAQSVAAQPSDTLVYENSANGQKNSFIVGANGANGIAHYKWSDGVVHDDMLIYRRTIELDDGKGGTEPRVTVWLYEAIGQQGSRCRWFLFGADHLVAINTNAYPVYYSGGESDNIDTATRWMVAGGTTRRDATRDEAISAVFKSIGIDQTILIDTVFQTSDADKYPRQLLWEHVQFALTKILGVSLDLHFGMTPDNRESRAYIIVTSQEHRRTLAQVLGIPDSAIRYPPNGVLNEQREVTAMVTHLASEFFDDLLNPDGTLNLDNIQVKLTKVLQAEESTLSRALIDFRGDTNQFALEAPDRSDGRLTLVSSWIHLADSGASIRLYWRARVELKRSNKVWNVVTRLECGQRFSSQGPKGIRLVGDLIGSGDLYVRDARSPDSAQYQLSVHSYVLTPVQYAVSGPALPPEAPESTMRRDLQKISDGLRQTVEAALIAQSR